jgi:hypothetical protein
MTEQPRDWDRDMAEIDRAIAKQGGVPPGGVPPPAPATRGGGLIVPPPPRRRSVALTWFWVGLALALGVALVVWPYQRSCGLQLVFFLGAAGVTALIGVLGALASWSNRRGFAHLVALLVIAWAAGVGLSEVLPRVGYARTSLPWMCPAGAPAPTAAPGVVPGK